MAVDYSVLFQGPTIGQRITQAQEANRLREESDVRNQLSRMQLEDARRKMEEDEYMNRLLARPEAVTPSGINYDLLTQQAQTEGRGRMVPKLLAARGAQEEATGKSEKAKLERLKAKFELVPQFYKMGINSADPSAAMRGIHDYMHNDKDIGEFLRSVGATPERGLETIEAAIAQGPDAVKRAMLDSISSVEQLYERFNPKPIVAPPSSSVHDPRTGTFKQAPPAPEGRTPTQKDYEYAVSRGFTGSFMDFKAAQRPPGTNVRVALPPQPKEEQEARGKLLVKGYEIIADAARVASRSLPALETQERVLDAGFRTGFGAEAQTTAARVLSALGVKNAEEYAKNSEGFSAAASQAVLQRQLEQKGVQTEADAQRISQTGAQLGNTPAGNKFIISVARAQFNRDIAQRNFYDSWWKKNGTYDGAEDAWFSGPGSKSLFESPELKQFAAPKPGKERPSLQSIFK